MDDRIPPGRRGIPLAELRENEPRLRQDRIGGGQYMHHRNGATPVPIERDDTARLNLEFAAAAAGTVGASMADDLIDRLAEKLSEKGHRGGGGGDHGHRWVATVAAILGVLFVLAAGWWGLSERLADRPTREELKELLMPRDSIVGDHEQRIRLQNDRLIQLDSTLRTVNNTLVEVKQELRERRGTDR